MDKYHILRDLRTKISHPFPCKPCRIMVHSNILVSSVTSTHKGMRVAIEGRIQTGSYTNRDGQKVYTTDVVVEWQEFLEKRADNGQQSPDNANNYDDRFMDIPDGIDEELPFN